MRTRISIRERLSRAFLGEKTLMNMLLGMAAILFSVGLFIGYTHDSNLIMLDQLAPFYVWGTLFSIYGGQKITGCLYRAPYYAKILNAILGLWLWSYLVLSCLVFDPKPLHPLEPMLLLALVCEVWTLAITIHCIKYALFRRRNDAFRS